MEKNIIKIRIPNTEFWVLGEQQIDGIWDTYLINSQSNYKEILKKDVATKSFELFSNIILKTPFPYEG